MGNCFGRKNDKTKEAPDKKTTEPPPDETNKERETEPTVTEGSKNDRVFAQQLLEAQNNFRAKHGVPPLTLSEQLCNDAQSWADRIAAKGQLEHNNDTNHGENLGWTSGTLTGEATANMWYDEIKNYDFNKPRYSGNTGHFTQVVWKASKEFGAGIAKSNSGNYIVGRYFPAGNVTNAGQFEDNVLPLV